MRTVLVTGGARRLGGAIAQALAAAGHRVVIHHHGSASDANAVAARIGAVTAEADLSDLAQASALIGRARAAAGAPIDGLVNSASAFLFDRPEAIDPALFATLGAINAGAPSLLASALAAQDDVADGSVVNILDQKVANLNPDYFSYTCGKLALDGATRMLAQALGPRIRVNAVSPGLTLPSGDQTSEQFASVASRNLLRRPVGADAVADAVVYLIGSHGVTGQNLFVDCGQRFVASARDVMFEDATAEGAHG
ncbi:SDR family oxidoreductase [Sphingomonas sp. CROZ-RG-20F-R02-07]|uniref:SDR family oxidoreductase n=1 Tax=Sphingomonas sp. CROZ-RG-20F-R02-07 TaxID=2914832 RepID=UPI001F57C807|nr:SDR family oxidoreductase [Sphingomonas sp. CROZ-RG-20F-R02-07]